MDTLELVQHEDSAVFAQGTAFSIPDPVKSIQ